MSYIGRKSLQYTIVLPTGNTANVWGSIALFILIVCRDIQTNKYAAVLTYHQLILYSLWGILAGPIPVPHITRFVVRSEELRKFKIWPICHWGGEAHSNPSFRIINVIRGDIAGDVPVSSASETQPWTVLFNINFLHFIHIPQPTRVFHTPLAGSLCTTHHMIRLSALLTTATVSHIRSWNAFLIYDHWWVFLYAEFIHILNGDVVYL